MKDKFLGVFGALWKKDKKAPTKCLLAPSYDEGTAAMSEWVERWNLSDVRLYTGDDAGNRQAVAFLKAHERQTRLLIFVGHAKATGLLTQPGIGRSNSPICNHKHDCLLDTEDITTSLERVHIIAWGCDAGSYFGPKVAELKGSGFLGFNGPLNIIINHEPSENIWSSIMRELFTRISERGYIESHDAEWLRHEFLNRRRDIKSGLINTGVHNRINSMFLKAAAKNTVVQTSKG